MKINLTAKQFVLDEALRLYVDEKVEKLTQHGAKFHDVRIILAMEKHRALADVSLNVDGNTMVAKAETTDLHQSIDGVMEKIERQLTRHRSKRLGSQSRRTDIPLDVLAGGSGMDSGDCGVKVRTVPVVSVSTEQALVLMETLEENCMVYSDEAVGGLRIMHRRSDGNLEIIDPLIEG